jgi:hypothetical protein
MTNFPDCSQNFWKCRNLIFTQFDSIKNTPRNASAAFSLKKKSPLAYWAGFAPIERFLGRCLFFQELHKFVSVEPLNLQFEFLTKKTMSDQAESNEGENEVEMRIRTNQGKHL